MPRPTEDFLRKRSAEILVGKTSEVRIFDQEAEDAVPKFGKMEIITGKYLGKGGFCTVYELEKVLYKAEDKKKSAADRSSLITVQDKDYIANNFIRDGQGRYAIKLLTPDLYKKGDAQHFVSGVIDLSTEVKYLSVLRHPHIIKMRAMSTSDYCDADFFILMDKLYGTLDERVDVWKKTHKGFMMKKEVKEDFFAERVMVAHDLASALAFLHDNNIVYRDIKPENIGFDVRDDVKIFDFGLSVELKTSRDPNDTFKLSGNTGSPRYMAPEVALSQPYNEKCDVFSFGLLISLILDLKRPFEGFTHPKMVQKVWNGNARPKVNPKWPKNLQKMVPICWGRDIAKRPGFVEIKDNLYEAAQHLSGDGFLMDDTNRTEKSIMARKK